jgi:hypothetical protein
VWSALGFYPIAGGAPVYVTGSPMFEQAVISPVGGDSVTVTAPGVSLLGRYIQSAQLGERPLDRPWFTHEELFDAGSVSFEMGVQPNEAWGSDPTAAPPSMSTHELAAFGCPAAQADPEPEQIATSLTYSGPTRAKGNHLELAAILKTDAGAPIEGLELIFEVAGQKVVAVTDASGEAATSVLIPDHGREQTVDVRFVGDDRYLSSGVSEVIRWGNTKS